MSLVLVFLSHGRGGDKPDLENSWKIPVLTKYKFFRHYAQHDTTIHLGKNPFLGGGGNRHLKKEIKTFLFKKHFNSFIIVELFFL